jgi:hypothetical protein
MLRLQPEQILGTLERHAVRYVIIGGLGATLHGSPLVTHDADICPARDPENLERLAKALRDMKARIRTSDATEGVPFTCDATFLGQMKMLNLTTRFGDLDLSFEPAGTGGYDDLESRAVQSDLGDGLVVPLASLEDIIRSKEAANRDKDRLALPTLRLLLQKIKERQGSSGS